MPNAGNRRRLEMKAFYFLEERRIFRIGERIPPFDVVHAQLVQFGRNQQLVLQRQIESFTLRAITQRGIVDFDSTNGFHIAPEI